MEYFFNYLNVYRSSLLAKLVKQPVDTFLSVIQVLLADAWFSYILNATMKTSKQNCVKKIKKCNFAKHLELISGHSHPSHSNYSKFKVSQYKRLVKKLTCIPTYLGKNETDFPS